MLERLIAALFLLVFGLIAYRFVIWRQIKQTTALVPTDPLLSAVKPGVPTILYFTTPMCVPCKTQQMPALTRLQAELGDGVQIVRVDACEQPDAAQRWGVFSAPTTFVLDGRGVTQAINYGVAGADKLRQQLQGIA
jgi:thioredoxin-like negative regulator of GroEL